MITKTSKLSQQELERVIEVALHNASFSEQVPSATQGEASRAFKDPQNSWYTLTLDDRVTIFKLSLHQKLASVDRFYVAKDPLQDYPKLVSTLRHDLQEMGATVVRIKVPKNMAEQFVMNGFKETDEFLRFSGQPTEIRMMPILRIINATQRDVHELSKLLYEAYTVRTPSKFPTPESAELALRGIIDGREGKYLTDASFMSGTATNIVSACLITLDDCNVANVAELFTHPLYRARGLATTELAAAMNWLIKNNVETLAAVTESSNSVVRRLFAKIGLKEIDQLVELVTTF